MFWSVDKHFDDLGDFILKLTYPHERNDHEPWALRSHTLILFLGLIILVQVFSNIYSKNDNILGFATNINNSEIINLTNQERSKAGLNLLSTNAVLNNAANLKAKDMFEKNYWAHFAPDGTSPWYFFNLVGYRYSWAGENLARDFATSAGVVTAWMNSSGHKANILNPNYTEIGVSNVNGNLEGEDTTLVVQLFGRPLEVAAAPTANNNTGNVQKNPVKIEDELSLTTPKETVKSQNPQTGEKTTIPSSGSGEGVTIQANLGLFKNLTSSQKVTMSLLLLIGILFIFDSVIIFRKRHVRVNSHSFSHASIIMLLILISLLYGRGSIF